MALYIPDIRTSYQVFADGRLIGQLGGFPPHQEILRSLGVGTERLFLLPADLTSQGGSLTIAIRVWQWSGWSVGFGGAGPGASIFIGDAGLLNDRKDAAILGQFRDDFAGNILLFAYFLAGLAGLGLFLLRRREREYLWFALAELFNALAIACGDDLDFRPSGWQGHWALIGCLSVIISTSLFMFFVVLLKQRRTSIYWIGLAFAALAPAPTFAYSLNWISDSMWLGTSVLAHLPYAACVILIIFFAIRRGNLDARLLLGPVALSYSVGIVNFVIVALSIAGFTK